MINNYSITIKFTSLADGKVFHHTNIYGPPSPAEKASIIYWLYNIDVSTFEDWILMGVLN